MFSFVGVIAAFKTPAPHIAARSPVPCPPPQFCVPSSAFCPGRPSCVSIHRSRALRLCARCSLFGACSPWRPCFLWAQPLLRKGLPWSMSQVGFWQLIFVTSPTYLLQSSYQNLNCCTIYLFADSLSVSPIRMETTWGRNFLLFTVVFQNPAWCFSLAHA